MRTTGAKAGATAITAVLIGTLTLGATVAAAQPYDRGPPPPPPPYGQPAYGPSSSPPPPAGAPPIAPPPGTYAPPPQGAERAGSTYDDAAQRYDREYADRYSRWAQQYCVDRRNNSTAAGALIGGILGAVVGSNVSGRGSKTGGSIVGGALGAIAGGAIGSNSVESASCPPGYMVRSGAPQFDYGPPAYGPVVYGPSWYNPWFFEGGVWVYRPYRYWYWSNRTYWAPDYRPGRWEYHYRRY